VTLPAPSLSCRWTRCVRCPVLSCSVLMCCALLCCAVLCCCVAALRCAVLCIIACRRYDHFHNTLPKETVIHIWKSVTNVSAPLAGGYNVILNVGYNGLSWYLDNTATDWEHVYLNEPCCGVPDELCPMILGGHGEMWGETVDASDLQQTVWPRLAAVAERLWSPRFLNDTADAHDRIRSFRCLLTRRGVAAAPVDNPSARMAPTGPGSCLDQ
jgi:hexosaminidase